MSLFFKDANVTGTEHTVMEGLYPILCSSWPTRAVVAVTSVHPTSEKRTFWQTAGSRLAGDSAVDSAATAGVDAISAAVIDAISAAAAMAAAARDRLTPRLPGRHD